MIEVRKGSVVHATDPIILLDLENLTDAMFIRRTCKLITNRLQSYTDETFTRLSIQRQVDMVRGMITLFKEKNCDMVGIIGHQHPLKKCLRDNDDTRIGECCDFLLLTTRCKQPYKQPSDILFTTVHSISNHINTMEQLADQTYDIFFNIKEKLMFDERRRKITVAIPYGWCCRKSINNGNRKFKWEEVYDMLEFMSSTFHIDLVIYDHRK